MVRIFADTTSCLPVAEARAIGITYIPQIIVIGEETYRDDTEMSAKEFLLRQKGASILPKTAAPPPALYNLEFEKLSNTAETILILTPPARLSGTFRSATVAAQDFPQLDIRIIDTAIIAGGLGAVVKQAQAWAIAGQTADEIVANVMEMCARHHVYFAVDTLEYLYKGGRIGAASALLGSMLQMKPILTLKDGQIQPFERQHTHRKAIARIQEIITEQCPKRPGAFLSFMHGNAEGEARSIAQAAAPALGLDPTSIPIYDLTPAILTHAGPGVIAASFFVE